MQFLMYLGMLILGDAFGWVVNIFKVAQLMARICALDIIHQLAISSQWSAVNMKEGEIEFRNVCLFITIKPKRENISFIVPQNNTCDYRTHRMRKTTLVNLIPRLYDVTEGAVFIDGKNVKEIPLEILRKNIAIVPQETFLFSATVKENITFGVDGASMEEVARVAEIARIANDVQDFPNAYDTIVGERGITLSGGQKQRTSIARALITNPKILILDDALSAVDTHTEEKILRALQVFMKKRTSIIISHRISTVKDADNIIVLNESGIAEEGTHDELLARGGMYAELYEKQLLEEEVQQL